MKKIILGLLMLMGITGVQAQEYEYVPLVREGVKWVYYLHMTKYDDNGGYISGWTPLTLELKGDTSLTNLSTTRLYKKCYMTLDPEYARFFPIETDENGTVLVAMLRENDKRVYAVYTEEYMNAFILRPVIHSYVTGIALGGDRFADPEYIQNEEWMIYDFNEPELFLNFSRPKFVADGVCKYNFWKAIEKENVTINGTVRKKYAITYEGRVYDEVVQEDPMLIEGIGQVSPWAEMYLCTFISPHGELYHTTMTYCKFSHVEENNEVVYKGAFYDEFNTLDNVNDMKVETPENGDNNYYNLMGQPVAEPTQPGIYIHHGKKIVIK